MALVIWLRNYMDKYVELAKDTAENYTKNGRIMNLPKDLPDEFYSRRAGVFVTIRKRGQLRGCVGTYLPTKRNIAEEIIYNAVSACSKDSRFPPVSEDELSGLEYEISILSEPKLAADISKLDPKTHGIIVRANDGRSGLLLPDVEGAETTDQQISIACQKAGINPLLDEIKLYYFTTEKHK